MSRPGKEGCNDCLVVGDKRYCDMNCGPCVPPSDPLGIEAAIRIAKGHSKLTQELVKPVPIVQMRCKDDPEANGRVPMKGDQRFTLTFPLEDGRTLQVHMGKESMNHFETFIANMMIDDHNDAEATNAKT